MLGSNPSAPFRPDYRPTQTTSSARTASTKDVTALIDDHFAETDLAQIRSADIVTAMMNTPSEDAASVPPFNHHEPGSEAWYAHGVEYGVWVTGKLADRVVKATHPYRDNPRVIGFGRLEHRVRGVLTATAHQLQRLNDRIARLHAEGASRADLQQVIRKTITPMRGSDYELDISTGNSGADDFCRLYFAIRNCSPGRLFDEIADRNDWGSEFRLVESWATDVHRRLDLALDDFDVELDDPEQRRSDAFDDAMKRRHEVAKAIMTLPVDRQREAWAHYHARLTEHLNAVEDDSLPLVRDYPWPGRPEAGASAGVVRRSSGADHAEPAGGPMAELSRWRVESARLGLASDLASGTLDRHDRAVRGAIRNLIA